MTRSFIGMLRGVNVGGHRKVKMEDLRMMGGRLGFQNVHTYVQSGNIVFQTAASERPTLLSKRITGAIIHDFGFQVPVIIRTSEEMGRVITGNPPCQWRLLLEAGRRLILSSRSRRSF